MEMKINTAKNFILFFLISAAFFPLPAGAEEPYVLLPQPNPQAIYVLSEHLSEASAAVFVANRESRKGIWENDYFSFYGLNKDGNIQVLTETENNQSFQSIQMNSLPGANRVLQFLSVPSGAGIYFYYKTALAKPSKQNVYIYVMLQAGKKNIARFRVTCNQEGWQKQWIPLGVLRLFNRAFPLTITVVGDKTHQSSFQFYSEVYQ